MNFFINKKAFLTMVLFVSVNAVVAVPWCHHGTIVNIQNVSWSQSSIYANFPGTIPGWMNDYGITGTAMDNYGSSFAGGGGSLGGYSVPGSGQVRAHANSPSSYTSGNGYSTSQGVQFVLKKCYTIPPMVSVREERLASLPSDPGTPVIGVNYSAMSEIENACQLWSSPITDPELADDVEEHEQTTNDVHMVLQREKSRICR